METEQLLCWTGMTDTEHSTTFSSNDEEKIYQLPYFNSFYLRLLSADTNT